MLGRVRDSAILKGGKSTLRCDYDIYVINFGYPARAQFLRTEDLVAYIVLSNEVTQQLFVNASLIDNLVLILVIDYMQHYVYERTAVSQNVQPSSKAFSSTGSACSRVRLFPRPKLMPIAPKPGTGTLMLPNC